MKKFLVALITFTVGIIAFNLLETKQVSLPVKLAPQQTAVEISGLPIPDSSTEKIEHLQPFFDSFEENDYRGEYGGWFIADDFKGMKEVWTILLTRSSENSKSEKLVWSATILTENADGDTNDDDVFQSIWIKTKNDRLSFKSKKIRGIEYRFDGEFFKNGKEFLSDEKVLKGTLRKIFKGRETAKFTATFAYREPVCFH